MRGMLWNATSHEGSDTELQEELGVVGRVVLGTIRWFQRSGEVSSARLADGFTMIDVTCNYS